jgi:hypothetical protein
MLEVGKCRLQHGNEYGLIGYAGEAIEVCSLIFISFSTSY